MWILSCTRVLSEMCLYMYTSVYPHEIHYTMYTNWICDVRIILCVKDVTKSCALLAVTGDQKRSHVANLDKRKQGKFCHKQSGAVA